jgi:carboxyl-terminal processing protease
MEFRLKATRANRARTARRGDSLAGARRCAAGSARDRHPRRAPRGLATVVTTLAALLVVAASPGSAAEQSLTCKLLPKFLTAYLQHHVLYHQLDLQLETRTIDTYLRRLDPSRSLLIEPEADALKTSLAGLFVALEAGDCTRIHELHQAMIGHHRAAELFVREIVHKPDFEIDETLELVIDPDERGQPKSPDERDALNRKLVHFQLSNYLSAGTPLDEAKDLLIHRYELRSKRYADLDPEDLYVGVLDAFAISLDPHSNYLSAEMLEDFRISMSLSLEGIGVALSERDGYAVAERIIPGGAADRHAVLQPKDKIIAVSEGAKDAVSIIDMPLREAVALIRGRKGTDVGLTVLRQGENTERFVVTITRDTIDLAEQAAKLRFEERKIGDGEETLKLAVIELPSFYGDSGSAARQCTNDMERLLNEAREAGADGLVLDLSRNGGGLLEHAVRISGFFLRTGEVVRIENSQGQAQGLWDRDGTVLWAGPMVVHTSRISASASEILAGALRDYGRAVITGDDHTFGKGTVQTVSTQREGLGALKITTALFFRPGGRSTQNDGVAAHVVIPSLFSREDFGERSHDYALPGQAVEPFISPTANGPDEGQWTPITEGVLETLAALSQARVADNPEFAEVLEKLEEARASNGVVKIADILAKSEEKNADEDKAEEKKKDETGDGTETGNGTENGKDDEAGDASDDNDAAAAGEDETEEKDELSPQVEEALNVLTDLIRAQRN